MRAENASANRLQKCLGWGRASLGAATGAVLSVVPASGAAWPMQGSADAVDLDTAASDAADSGCVQSGCAAARGDNVGNGLKFVPIFPAARGFLTNRCASPFTKRGSSSTCSGGASSSSRTLLTAATSASERRNLADAHGRGHSASVTTAAERDASRQAHRPPNTRARPRAHGPTPAPADRQRSRRAAQSPRRRTR